MTTIEEVVKKYPNEMSAGEFSIKVRDYEKALQERQLLAHSSLEDNAWTLAAGIEKALRKYYQTELLPFNMILRDGLDGFCDYVIETRRNRVIVYEVKNSFSRVVFLIGKVVNVSQDFEFFRNAHLEYIKDFFDELLKLIEKQDEELKVKAKALLHE